MVKKVPFVHLLLYSSEAGFPLLVCKRNVGNSGSDSLIHVFFITVFYF